MNHQFPLAYAVKHRDSEIRANSRSGGIFTALSDQILSRGGVIYGCVLDDRFDAVHIRAEDADGRNRMRGSKYTQSRIGDCFRQAKEDLQAGRPVLFSGTSCQVAGLKAFLGQDYENLLLVDIVCHGVPSPAVWQAYLQWNRSKYRSQIQRVDFRNKRDYGWAAHVESLWLKRGNRIRQIDSRVYRNLFYRHNILRPACYQCPYKSTTHPADITIADFWGIQKAAPGFNDDRGVSLVLLNSTKGLAQFEQVKERLQMSAVKLQDCLQKPLVAPFPRPAGREDFWKDFQTQPFGAVVKKYGAYSLKDRVKDRIKKYAVRAKKAT